MRSTKMPGTHAGGSRVKRGAHEGPSETTPPSPLLQQFTMHSNSVSSIPTKYSVPTGCACLCTYLHAARYKCGSKKKNTYSNKPNSICSKVFAAVAAASSPDCASLRGRIGSTWCAGRSYRAAFAFAVDEGVPPGSYTNRHSSSLPLLGLLVRLAVLMRNCRVRERT
jgi:hypothetical protein